MVAALEFSTHCCAIPLIGGILADLPLRARTASRIPAEFRLPVTVSAATAGRGWVVVEYDGRGVAMLASEAAARGLTEAPNWIPDATARRFDFA